MTEAQCANTVEEMQEFEESGGLVSCGECGYVDKVEPDGDYLCVNCGEGRLTSPYIKLGII